MWFGLSFFAIGICGLLFLSFFLSFVFVTGICVQFLSYTAFSAVGIRARLSVFAFFLSYCPQMLKSILGTNCDVDRLVLWLRRGPVRLPLFFRKPGFVGLKINVQRPAEFLFTFRVLLFSRLFSLICCLAFVLFLRKGRGICR